MKLKVLGFLVTIMLILVGCNANDDEAQAVEPEENEEQIQEEENNEEESTEAEAVEADTTDSATNEDDEVNEEEQEENQNSSQTGEGSVVAFEDIQLTVPADAIKYDDSEEMGFKSVGYTIDMLTGANFNIVLEELPAEYDLSLEDYIELAIENGGLNLSKNERFELNGIEWAELETEYDGLPVNQRVFVHNDAAYIFSYSAYPEDFNELLPIYDEVIASVEIVN